MKTAETSTLIPPGYRMCHYSKCMQPFQLRQRYPDQIYCKPACGRQAREEKRVLTLQKEQLKKGHGNHGSFARRQARNMADAVERLLNGGRSAISNLEELRIRNLVGQLLKAGLPSRELIRKAKKRREERREEQRRLASTKKTCSRCHVKKLRTEFHVNRIRRDGRNSWCKDCKNGYRREIRAIAKEAHE